MFRIVTRICGVHHLFVGILHGTIELLHERRGLAELGERAFQQVVAREEIVAERVAERYFLQPQQFVVGRVRRKPCGRAPQSLRFVERESFGAPDVPDKFRAIVQNLLAYASEHRGMRHVESGKKHVAADESLLGGAFEVEIVARIPRFFTVRCDVDALPGLVRRFVAAETHVAVDAVGTVLSGQPLDRGVERGDSLDQPFGEAADTLLQLQPFGAVRLEPCAFVVSVQLSQEFDDRLHATRRKADIATSVR